MEVAEQLNVEIRTPRFIEQFHTISEEDACIVARKLNLPNVTGVDDVLDAKIGLGFCRGRGIDAQTALTPRYEEEAAHLPKDLEGLVVYFSHISKEDTEDAVRQDALEQEQLEQDLLNLELDMLAYSGVDVPDTVTDLESYFQWLAANHELAFGAGKLIPDRYDMQAFKYEFYKTYMRLYLQMKRSFNPHEAWSLYLQQQREQLRDNPSAFLDRTYYTRFRTYENPRSLGASLRNGREKNKESLLFHVTKLSSALNIVTTGEMRSGVGSSFTMDGISHPRGGTEGEKQTNHVAFVLPYATAINSCAGAVDGEPTRPYEREVNASLPIKSDVFIGVLPIHDSLFPDVLQQGVFTDNSRTGAFVRECRERYQQTGRILGLRERDEVVRIAHEYTVNPVVLQSAKSPKRRSLFARIFKKG